MRIINCVYIYTHVFRYVRTHKAVSDMSRSGITDQGPSIRPKEVNRMKKMKKTLANPLSSQQKCSIGPVIRAIQL